MKRRTKILVALLLGWLLTLGIFHERSLSSHFTIRGADAWKRFETGTSRVYPNTWVNTAHTESRGVPYLLLSTVDVGPYPLSFCFIAAESDTAKAMVLHEIEIRYEDGSSERVRISDEGIREEFSLDERGKERGETVYKRVNFLFPDAISKRQNSRVFFKGYFESPVGQEAYTEEIELQLDVESHVYIGWVALLLRQL